MHGINNPKYCAIVLRIKLAQVYEDDIGIHSGVYIEPSLRSHLRRTAVAPREIQCQHHPKLYTLNPDVSESRIAVTRAQKE